MKDDKAFFTPPEERRSSQALLGTTELEYLDRLVTAGEGLLHPDLTFAQARTLLKTGHAVIKTVYPSGIQLIVPTELGRTLAAIREREKLERAMRIPTWKVSKT